MGENENESYPYSMHPLVSEENLKPYGNTVHAPGVVFCVGLPICSWRFPSSLGYSEYTYDYDPYEKRKCKKYGLWFWLTFG